MAKVMMRGSGKVREWEGRQEIRKTSVRIERVRPD